MIVYTWCSIIFIHVVSCTESQPNNVPWLLSGNSLQRERRSPIFSSSDILHECKELEHLCTRGDIILENNELSPLECALSADIFTKLSKTCQQSVKKRAKSLTSNDNLKQMLNKHCRLDAHYQRCLDDFSQFDGSIFSCLISVSDQLHDLCYGLMNRITGVVLHDVQMVDIFYDSCKKDLQKFHCNHIQAEVKPKTLSCLQSKLDELEPKCHQQVVRLTEAQSANFKYDEQLYTACLQDKAKFCEHLESNGDGAVFECLVTNKNDVAMSQKCRDQLTRRQQLISKDYKVSRSLTKACRDDIRQHHCKKNALTNDKEIRLAQILLCLETIYHNGTKLHEKCRAEMVEHRKMLWDDYHLSPEIADGCADALVKQCKLETGGNVIHCLMKLSMRKKIANPKCVRALEDLVKKTDAGEDWRVDPVLREACQPVVNRVCWDMTGGDAKVMYCLIDKIGTEFMTPKCEQALVQIQYFVARDFKLDPQLYKACKLDAVQLCHAKPQWENFGETYAPETAPLVLPCLYRYVYRNANRSLHLKGECINEIRRVMRQRAASVDLLPEIEEVCIDDLSLFCFDKTQNREEMQCLQDNLDKLKKKCQEALSNFIEDQAGHIELNPLLNQHCHKMMEKFCSSELKQSGQDTGDVMECLINHKNEPVMRAEVKCRATVEHLQLISLKNYHFTYKFKEACKHNVARLCPQVKTKNEVIECLSTRVRNDTLMNIKSSVSKDCRQQLKAQLLQQKENIDFDPKLKATCLNDINKYCASVERGNGKILECLHENAEQLSEPCKKLIFNVEKQEIMDSSLDYALVTTCQEMIRLHCPNPEHALECLKGKKDEVMFDANCKKVVLQRMVEEYKDYRLNPQLQASCLNDINKHCKNVINDKEFNGAVIKCLKQKFRDDMLTKRCQNEMINILREQALHYNLNPLLTAVCQKEIDIMCKPETTDDYEASMHVQECLKRLLLKKKIFNKECETEVAGMIAEGKADVHVDPLLQSTCSIDLMRYCGEVTRGGGRLLKCLQIAMESSDKPLEAKCKHMLIERMEMFQYAANLVAPETLQQLYTQVVVSPSRRYFLAVGMGMIVFIFAIGLLCGQITRTAMYAKMK